MIENLKCEYLENPIGIDTLKPVFSWNIYNKTKLVSQLQYRLIVKLKNRVCYDSGIVKSKQEIGIEYNGEKLISLKKYDFQVIVTTTDNETHTKSGYFVTGLLNKKEKDGKWIIHPNFHDNPIFYKDIIIKGKINSAYIAISGLGYYEFTINDIKAHNSILVPAWTDYMERNLSDFSYYYDNNSDKIVLYNTYDVKDFFKKGTNSIKIMIGNGWFGQKERNYEGNMEYGCPRLFLKLVIEYVNGEKQEILSDESFYVTTGPYEFNNIYFGEIYNDNIGRDFSYNLNANTIDEKMGVLKSQYAGYDKVIKEYKPKHISNNIYGVDENISGFVRLKAKACRGAKITLKFFEELNDDMTPNYHSCGDEWQLQSDTYIFFDDKEIIYEPKFTWHGFKYFLIEKDNDVDVIDLKVIRVHSDINIKSNIVTDNKTINWLYKTYLSTQLSNYHGLVPSNCPHRERLGYVKEGGSTINAALYSFDSYYLYNKWNRDLIISQNKDSGFIPNTVPFYGSNSNFDGNMSVAIIVYTLYKHTFDKRILENSYDTIVGVVEYLKNNSTNYIINKDRNSTSEIDQLVNTCYFYNSVNILETIATILDYESGEYNKLKQDIANAINEKYFNKTIGSYTQKTYWENVYPLYFNIVPEEYKESVIKHIENAIINNGYVMPMDIFASNLLPEVLIENNKGYLLKDIFNNNNYPSFEYMRQNKATTLWETWDKGSSINSPMLGGITSYLFKYIAGIKYINSNNEIIIEPKFNIGINKCNFEYLSIYGRISINWIKMEDHISISIDIPSNVKVVFVHNDDIKILEDINNKFLIKGESSE